MHLHVSAAIPLTLILNLTYEDNVYYSMEDNRLFTFLDSPWEGYQKCNELRKNWTQNETFDDFLISKILKVSQKGSRGGDPEVVMCEWGQR